MSARTTGRTGGTTRGGTGRVQRRGTVLLMVVGVLALMSIVAVVYVTIGQADRRGAAALVREQRLDDQSKSVADYLAQIIADDAVDVQTLVDPSGLELNLREAWDAPTFSTAMRTQPPLNPGQIRFDPVGQGTDPWLSDPEPTWLRYLRNDSPRDGGGPARYLDNLDWGQISDPWPDGRFVNLGNIRGNFGAEPGVATDADGRPRTSWGLTVFTRGAGMEVQRVGTPTAPLNIRLDNNQTGADPKSPWHWATRQVNMFRPYREVDSRAGRPGVGTLVMPFITFGTPEWLPNQWVDTDGDGLVDARWSDMVDTFNPAAPRPLLRADGSMRFFVATRIIDLSGLVNVNVAGDLHSPLPGTGLADDQYPLGLTPGDIDLRSLLTMAKVHDMLGANEVYELLEQPQVQPTLPSDYSGAYGAAYDNASARDTGFAGYTALVRARRDGMLRQGPVDVSTNGGDVLGRAAKYDAFQRLASAEGTRPDGTGQVEAAFAFGVADQAELMTYWGTNDPAVTSALETALDNRWDNGGGATADEARFGPLRSIRPLSVEREGVGNFFPGGANQTAPHVQNDGMPDDDALLKASVDPRHLITAVSGSRPIISNPVSGPGAPLGAGDVAEDVYTLLELTTPEGVQKIFRAYCQALLPWSAAHFPAASPQIEQPPWVIEGNQFTAGGKSDRARTLSYGWRGPELPLWQSAFMAVNLKDAYDTDDNPTSFTLLIDNSYRTSGNNWNTARFPGGTLPETLTAVPPGATTSPFWPAKSGQDRILDLGQLTGDPNRIATTQTSWPPLNNPLESRPLAAPAINIFGAEAQPFLTQVALYSCFTDSITEDDEQIAYVDLNSNGNRDDIEVSKVSIRGDVDGSNDDFVFQVIAFQIHNPFERSISLNAGTTGAGPFTLQYGRSRFEFAAGVTIDSRATKVFYCVTPGRATATSRVQSVWSGPADPAFTLDAWITSQLGIAATDLNQQQLLRYDVGSAIGSPVVGDTSVLGFIDAALPDDNRVALLWRRQTVAGEPEPRPILVDRMRDPELTGVPSLDRSFKLDDYGPWAPGAVHENVAGTDVAEGGPDNTGYSLITFGSFRRPDDPGAAGVGIPLGAIPAFCIERRGFNVGGDRPLNVGPNDDSSLKDAFTLLGTDAQMTKADFAGSLGAPSPGKTTLAALLGPQAGTAATDILLPSIKVNPRARSGRRINANIAGVPYNDKYVEAFLPNNRFRLPAPSTVRTLRPTDLLLPWAIGSWELPGVSGLPVWRSERRIRPSAGSPTPLEWTTVSEMLSVALDYEAPPAGVKDIFFDQTLAQPWRAGDQVWDRGCLRIDRFCPFIDLNNDRIFGIKPGSNPPEPEDIVPPGIPPATTIVDRLRVHEAGSLTRNVPGLVNVNTAPLEVLRALPVLTPPSAALNVGANVWFWPGVQDSLCDIGATMLAYRDNIGLWPRDIAAGGVSSTQINFRPDNNPSPPGQNGFGRRWKTGIQALRQPYTRGTGVNQIDGRMDRSQNGFRSIGETMIVRDASIPGGGPGTPTVTPYSIDRLAHDGQNVGGTQAEPVFIADTTRYNSGSGPRPNQIIDDYQEQFALSGALMNSISVRSDVFAAWFVLRGYTVNDCEGLEIQEPMVPTVERRFLMIVDRSNVTQRGQKPRILLMKELPM